MTPRPRIRQPGLRWLSALTVAALLASLGACGRSRSAGGAETADGGPLVDGGGVGGALVAIQVEPPTVELLPGLDRALRATGVTADDEVEDLTDRVTWTSEAPEVAQVDEAGRLLAIAPGTALVTATRDGVTGETRVTVLEEQVVDLGISPASATTAVGGTVAFTAAATLDGGAVIDVTGSAVWAVADPAVASIDEDGGLQAVAPGSTTVRAEVDGVIGEASLTVTDAPLVALEVAPVDPVLPVGGEQAFQATGLYEDGTRATLTASVVWRSSAPETLSIDPTGAAVAEAPGTAIVSAATESGVEAASTVTVTEARVDALTLTPERATLGAGETVDLRAEATLSDGTVLEVTRTVTWTSSVPEVASVSNTPGQEGRVTGLDPGETTVRARLSGVEGTATVTVSEAALVALTVEPGVVTVPVDTTTALAAFGEFSDGSRREVTTAVDWTSDAPAVASVSNAPGRAGEVTGLAAGEAEIRATLDGRTALARAVVTDAALGTITVTPAAASTTVGLRSDYRAVARFADGTTAEVTDQVTWSTTDEDVATISNGSGVEGQLLAVGPGTADVVATLDAIVGRTSVTVDAPALDGLQVSPIDARLPAGATLQYQAIALFSNGTSQNVTRRASWTIADPAVASVNALGRVAFDAPGRTTITATFMEATGSTPLTVSDAEVESLTLTPVAPSLPAGARVRFQVVALFSDGTSRNVTSGATFRSSDPEVLQVGSGAFDRGLATGISAGTATVTASFEGLSASQPVTVSAATLDELQVTPAVWETPVGGVQQLQAVAIFSDGTSRNVTGAATWSSSAPTVAQVTSGGGSRGRATALAAGEATLTATFDGASDTARVTVTAAEIEALQVTPFAPEVAAGLPLQFQAVALYDDGTSENVTGRATWTSSSPEVAEVTTGAGSRGRATALAAGSTTITARFDGASGSARLTVTEATIDRIQVTPFLPTLPTGFGTQMQAVAVYTDETTRNVTGLATWSSSDDAVAAVSNAFGSRGQLAALSAGTATITARFEGVRGTTSATVTSATLDGITVAPGTATVSVRGVQAFAATGAFSDGSTLDITDEVTWSSTDRSVADVSNAAGSRGEATGFAPGTTAVRASRSGVRGEATLTVE